MARRAARARLSAAERRGGAAKRRRSGAAAASRHKGARAVRCEGRDRPAELVEVLQFAHVEARAGLDVEGFPAESGGEVAGEGDEDEGREHAELRAGRRKKGVAMLRRALGERRERRAGARRGDIRRRGAQCR